MKIKFVSVLYQLIFAISLTVVLSSCGKFGDPLPPAAYAPKAVNNLIVTADTNGVRFQWVSPTEDRLGEELESLDGYLVYRVDAPTARERATLFYEDDIIATLEDRSIIERDAQRKVAREEGRISRKIAQPAELTTFEYLDTSVSPGTGYLYKIVPVNQDGVKGAHENLIQVVFRGTTSEIRLFDSGGVEATAPQLTF